MTSLRFASRTRRDSPGDPRLAAYVALKPGAAVTASQLRQFLKGKLPDYMLPASVVVLGALPHTASGKIDRRALPAPSENRQERQRSYAPPRTATEEQLAQLWSDVLGTETVGIHDDFFELGGQSLLAMRLVSRVRERFRVELPLKDLFQASTVAGLSELIEGAERREAIAAIQPVATPDDSDEILSNIDRLSDEEVRARLTGLLAEDPLALDD